MAGLGYFRTARTHTCSTEEYNQQSEIIKTILREKGFHKNIIHELEHPKTQKPSNDSTKRFIGTTEFDKVSNRHIYVKKILVKSLLDKNKFFLPADIPGRKLEQFIFTIKKMRQKLMF